MSPRTYVSTEIDQETRKRLTSGDVKGEPMEPEEQFPEGVAARRPDGERVFYDESYLAAMRHRNRGKD